MEEEFLKELQALLTMYDATIDATVGLGGQPNLEIEFPGHCINFDVLSINKRTIAKLLKNSGV